MLTAMAMPFAACAFALGSPPPADVRQLVKLWGLVHMPWGSPSFSLGCVCGKDVTFPAICLLLLGLGLRKEGKPPLSAVIHHLGVNCSSK